VYIGRRWLPRKPIRYADYAIRAIAIFLASLSKSDATVFPSFLQPAVTNIQHGWYIPAALMLSPFVSWLRSGAESVKLDEVHALLDEVRNGTFDKDDTKEEQDQRVTLFKYQRVAFRWPFFGKWLVPVERSGTMTRRTTAIFRVGDTARQCEGVAGRAWSRNRNYQIQNLPDPSSGVAKDVKDYAERSHVTIDKVNEYVKKKKALPRSMLGVPIEVKNEKWGVVVFDTVEPNMNVSRAEKLIRTFNRTLVGYLRR
jgi:hypothetical protein